ncbi:MAG: TadE/TadG family type IV pilus assembly protein [Planctomycetaceae bacterium]
MQRLTKQQTNRSRRGAAMVEFAIIAPVFLTLVIGLLEAGQALRAANVMAAAVREGGRLAAMDWNDFVPEGFTPNDKVISDVRNFLIASGLPGEEAVIQITSAEGEDEGEEFDLTNTSNNYRLFKISIEIEYDEVSTFPSTFMYGQTLTSSLTFRAVRSHAG